MSMRRVKNDDIDVYQMRMTCVAAHSIDIMFSLVTSKILDLVGRVLPHAFFISSTIYMYSTVLKIPPSQYSDFINILRLYRVTRIGSKVRVAVYWGSEAYICKILQSALAPAHLSHGW